MCTRCAFLGGLAGFVSAPGIASARTGDPQELELAIPGMQRFSDTVWLGRLSAHVWIHTTTHDLGGDYYPANGALIVGGSESLLIDTAWTNAQTTAILDAWERLRMPAIAKAVVTHFHYDRLGEIAALTERSIPAYGNPRTIGLALDNGHLPPRPLHELEKHPQRLAAAEIFYPGAGHTLDNIVVWVPHDGVLFGGCLIKATTATDLGNLEDAAVGAYAATVRKLARRYSPRRVIPGHGTIAGDSITHTIALTERLGEKR